MAVCRVPKMNYSNQPDRKRPTGQRSLVVTHTKGTVNSDLPLGRPAA